ncbi:cardiolipin synthase [Terrisporobacter petrolearius]|uniref:cardiolipin synthase n=1 Tax=Terrisporobacter petrolearius TaxID=1460447 RepID=UPI0031CC9517
MKKPYKNSIQRLIFFFLTLAVQIYIIILVILQSREYFLYFYLISLILGCILVIYILNGKSNPSYKIAWIVPILILPIFGGTFYLIYGGNKLSKREKKKMKNQNIKMKSSLIQDYDVLKRLEKESEYAKNQSLYILDYANCPIYENCYNEYLSPGEAKFEKLIEELKKAKYFIFLEYFIIEEGIMWNTILDILKEKVKEGVDVRVIYDDVGCVMKLPYKYADELQKHGIKCRVFNPFVPLFTNRLNNRDHRKITVIDGYVGFMGGINLADEYINTYEKYGHWKDAAILIKGDAVFNLTVMFLSIWDFINNTNDDYLKYKPENYTNEKYLSSGYIQPFDDSPLVNEPIGETVYLNLINKAKNYIYINTPYLIIDNEMATALKIASKSGVDVRIVTPHIPDKWFVHAVTKSYYHSFIKDGIKIYEYTPGFMHSKTFVVDDEYAVVGSINLDFRSLYLHFECGAWLYKTDSVLKVKDDFNETLELCQKISLKECENIKWPVKFGRLILRLFSPLM